MRIVGADADLTRAPKLTDQAPPACNLLSALILVASRVISALSAPWSNPRRPQQYRPNSVVVSDLNFPVREFLRGEDLNMPIISRSGKLSCKRQPNG